MEKKPDKVPSKTSQDDDKEERTTFALKSRAAKPEQASNETKDTSRDDDKEERTTFALKSRAAKQEQASNETETEPEDAEETKSTSFNMQRRATRYPGPIVDDNDDDDEAEDTAEAKATNIRMQRRATTYPTAIQLTAEDDDDDADEDGGGKKGTAFQLQRQGSDDEETSRDAESSKVTPFQLQRRATRYPGPIDTDAKDDDDDESEEEAEKPPTINLQRRASKFPTAAELSKLVDHEAETSGETKPAVPHSVLKIRLPGEEATTSDNNQAERSEESRAFPPSALKSRFASPTTAGTGETQSRGEEPKEMVPQSVLKSRPLHDIDRMEIPSFIAKSSDSFRYYKYNLKALGDDANNYDFASARPAMSKNSVSESIFHFVKTCLGSGVVTMPKAYKFIGIWTACGLNIVMGVFVGYAMYMLTRSAQKLYGRVRVPLMLYPDVAQACLEVGPWKEYRKYGTWFRYTVDFTIGFGLFSVCCVYQVAMAMILKQLVEGSYRLLPEGNPPLTTYILLLIVPCFLICMITTLKYLAPFTVIIDLYFACVAVTTMYYGITVPTISVVDYPAFKTVPGVFQFFGICIFSMNGIGSSMSIENYMTEPKKFPIVMIIGMAIVTCEVGLIGFFGHMAYGDGVQPLITLNYSYRPFPIVLKIFLSLVLYVNYALNFWVAFELVWYYVKLRHAPAQYWFWERIYRTMFVIILNMIAYLLPDVYYFTALVGTLCMSNLVFIYPAFIELLVDWKEPGLGFLRWRLVKFIVFFLIGLVMFFGGTYLNTGGLIGKVFYNTMLGAYVTPKP